MNWDLFYLLKQLIKNNQVSISEKELENNFKLIAMSGNKQKAIYLLIKKLIEVSQDKSLGMKAGKLISPNSFSGLGYLFMTAKNLMTACQRMCEFPLFYQNVVSLNTKCDEHYFILVIDNNHHEPLIRAIINEASLGVIYQYVSWLNRENFVECEVQLNHSSISSLATYREHFHRNPIFQQSENRLCFPIEFAKATLRSSDPEHHATWYCQLKEKHDKISQSFLSRAQTAIRNGLKLGNISRPDIAKQLSLSEKTLERRLEKSNFSFRKLTESIRLELAQKYLAQAEFSIEEIAHQLGYCDRNTFSKAFKKWTGTTPCQQRRVFAKNKAYQ